MFIRTSCQGLTKGLILLKWSQLFLSCVFFQSRVSLQLEAGSCHDLYVVEKLKEFRTATKTMPTWIKKIAGATAFMFYSLNELYTASIYIHNEIALIVYISILSP